MKRTTSIFLVLILANVPLVADDLYMVSVDRTFIYASKQRQAVVFRGEIFRGADHPWDRSLIRLQRDGDWWTGHKKYFVTETALQRDRELARVRAEANLQGVNRQLQAYYERHLKLHDAILHAQHDTALYYQARTRRVEVRGPNVRLGTGAPTGEERLVLSPRKAGKVIDDWQDELAALQKKIEALHEERRTNIQTIFKGRLRRSQMQNRFARFRKSPRTYRLTWHRVRAGGVRIYRRGSPQAALNRDEWVRAMPHPNNSSLVWVEYRQRAYTAHAAKLESWPDRQDRYLDERLALTDEIQQLENKAKFLAARMKQYPPLAQDLKYRPSFRRDRVEIPRISVRPGAGGRIAIELPANADILYLLDVSRARELTRDWRDELEDLALAMKRDRVALADKREQLVRLQAAFEKQQKSLAAAQAQ